MTPANALTPRADEDASSPVSTTGPKSPPESAPLRPKVSPLNLLIGTTMSVLAGGIAGLVAGFVWGGIGGRLAMRILFLTSDDNVRGLTSDDGFEIGRISGDTIFLVVAMTVLGAVIGGQYGLLRMLIKGPLWSVAIGMAMVMGFGAGGGGIVSSEGVDFVFLKPLWLAVALFIFLPAAWAASVVILTERLVHSRWLSRHGLMTPGVDARPLGVFGSAIAWGLLLTGTVAGTIDLLGELEKLT